MKPTESTTNKAIVLYDGACPLCRKSVAILGRFDWRKRLTYQDARDVDHLPATSVPLQPERLLQEMHLLTPDRKCAYSGYRAFRWIAGRLPPLWPVWPLLFLPGVPWLGQRAYRWVARNRYNLLPCQEGSCAVPSRPQVKKPTALPNSNGVTRKAV
jgi:predicted DCC family thiol-disulfide oxidoreductase YuxK